MSKQGLVVAAALVLGVFALAGSVMGLEAEGTIAGTEYGSFTLDDKGGGQRLFNESSRTTRYAPDTWRPEIGDKVTITYSEIPKVSTIVLAVDVVTLVERGPNSAEVASPVSVQIIEKSGALVKGTIEGTDKTMTFRTDLSTVWDPVDWDPNEGDKAKVNFHIQASDIGLSLIYVAEKIQHGE